MNATEWLIARLVPTHPDVQAGWVVNLDGDDNETNRWPVAAIPSMVPRGQPGGRLDEPKPPGEPGR